MIAVIFEVHPTPSGMNEYLEIATHLRSFLEKQQGFISIERFQSLVDEGKILSLSFWENEQAIKSWRTQFEHRQAQRKGKEQLFSHYRIRVAEVVRDYTAQERTQAPEDSNESLL
jgi:heme-degrading monooxygenase HmoA